jgi:BlaI family transcriptional regulator, penicillinase repressor
VTESRCPELTPAEFNLMKVLWRLRRATVAEARAALTEKSGGELAYTTVMTLLGRLATKGAVVVDREREPYVYKPAFRRESVLRERLKGFLADVFDGEASSMVLHLVDSEHLSLDELRAIEKRVEGDERAETPAPAPIKPRRGRKDDPR